MSSIQSVSQTLPSVTQGVASNPAANQPSVASPDQDGDTDNGGAQLSAANPPGVGINVDVTV